MTQHFSTVAGFPGFIGLFTIGRSNQDYRPYALLGLKNHAPIYSLG